MVVKIDFKVLNKYFVFNLRVFNLRKSA